MDHVELFGTIRLQDRSEKRRAMARRMCVCAVCVLCVCCVCARAQLAYHSKQVTRPTPSPILCARPLSTPLRSRRRPRRPARGNGFRCVVDWAKLGSNS